MATTEQHHSQLSEFENSARQELNSKTLGIKQFCSLPRAKERLFSPDVSGPREKAIVNNDKKWANGTNIHYSFFGPEDGEYVRRNDGSQIWMTYKGSPKEEDVVRKAFQLWKDVGIGLVFAETSDRLQSEVRIGFLKDNSSWSYLGRDVLKYGSNSRTMNFGWNIENDIDTALHEIGHTLGFCHEHQNPFAGIEWNENEVRTYFRNEPNFWDDETIEYNILRKLGKHESPKGSEWDPDSIMHYEFKPGLVNNPQNFKLSGISPKGGLSITDCRWAKTFYPPLSQVSYVHINQLQSVPVQAEKGEQDNFTFTPNTSKKYSIRTFGESDGVLVLFTRDPEGKLIYLSGDDDSGDSRNAIIEHRLFKGQEYLIGYRNFYNRHNQPALMVY